MRFYRSFAVVPCVAAIFLMLSADPAHAQVRFGVQGWASITPDQAFVGGHAVTPPLVPNLRFRPGVDFGFGDDIMLTAINLEMTYTFASQREWNIYAGGGPAINIYNFDDFGTAIDGTDTRAGFNLIVGAMHGSGLFAEMKIGTIDSPDLKFGVGYTFR